MKALTLWQPWATLVAIGAKTIETRSWATDYRGPLAIHASKSRLTDAEIFELCSAETAIGFALPDGMFDFPRGVIVAVGRLTGCHATQSMPYEDYVAERRLGDFSHGRFGWLIEDVRPLAAPVPCRGAQGLWTVPADVERAIAEQIDGRPA